MLVSRVNGEFRASQFVARYVDLPIRVYQLHPLFASIMSNTIFDQNIVAGCGIRVDDIVCWIRDECRQVCVATGDRVSNSNSNSCCCCRTAHFTACSHRPEPCKRM